MSEAGFSLETATRRGGVEMLDFWDAEETRERMEERLAERSEARWGEMVIFMFEVVVGEGSVPLVAAEEGLGGDAIAHTGFECR